MNVKALLLDLKQRKGGQIKLESFRAKERLADVKGPSFNMVIEKQKHFQHPGPESVMESFLT